MKIYLMALLWAMLFFASTTRGQTPLIYECKGEGDNNLADFVITNLLPQGFEGCAPIDCNPYFVSSREVEGSCFTHQWFFNNEPDANLQAFKFCKSFELGANTKVKHQVIIDDDQGIRTYIAKCTFKPQQCCNLAFQVNLLNTQVIDPASEHKVCQITVEEVFNTNLVTKYLVETLDQVLYDGTTPQQTYTVPCGKKGEMICFTAEAENENCQQTKCILLDVIPANEAMPRQVAKISNEEITLKCFPNPASDLLTINATIPQNTSGVLQIINALGSKVYEANLEVGQNLKSINIDSYSSGTYFVIIKNNNNITAAQKVVLIKK